MGDAFDSIFGGEEDAPEIVMSAPGRRRKWRDPETGLPTGVVLPENDPIFSPRNWGKPTLIEVIPGHIYKFYRPNVLARILNKSRPTLKFWEQEGHVPKPPFRFRYENTVRNYYDEETILVLLRLLNERGLLVGDRIDWVRHKDLPGRISKEWARVRDRWLEEIKQLKEDQEAANAAG